MAVGSILVAAPDGFYWARNDRYEISFYDTAGSLTRVLTRPVVPEALDRPAQAEYVEATLGTLRARGGEGVGRFEELFSTAVFADTRPLFSNAFVDWDRRLWLAAWPWPSRFDPPSHWSVFDRSGAWLGDVETPPGLMLTDARGDTVVGTWRDEFDVGYVQIHLLGGTS